MFLDKSSNKQILGTEGWGYYPHCTRKAIPKATKELTEKEEVTQQLIKDNSQLRTDLSAQTSTIELLEQDLKKYQNELDRYREILNIIFTLVNSDPNYYGQTTPFFEYRHLANPDNCEFEISPNDRVYKDFLNLVGPEAKIRIEEIVEKGEFTVDRSGKRCDVNTVIFGTKIDMDVKKSPSGLSLYFAKHNPDRMHKNHHDKYYHLSK